jgi:hypothetical protein
MAGLWSKKFDHVNGETRKCKDCGDEYHATKPGWRCKKCVAKINFDTAKNKYPKGIVPTGKWAGLPSKKPYPFNNRTSEASNRFCTIRTALSKAWKEYNKTGDRSIITQHYEKQLKEIEENGILTWILDRRCDASKKDTQVKSKNMIKKEYPDTRGYYEE